MLMLVLTPSAGAASARCLEGTPMGVDVDFDCGHAFSLDHLLKIAY
jgi:hypothetical protein